MIKVKTIIITILMVTLFTIIVYATAEIIDTSKTITPVVINKPVLEVKPDNNNVLYFKCGDSKELSSVTINEPDNKLDIQDIEFAVKPLCSDVISEIQNVDGDILKVNSNGLYSFSEQELIKDECISLGGYIDTKTNECIEKVYEDEETEIINNPFDTNN